MMSSLVNKCAEDQAADDVTKSLHDLLALPRTDAQTRQMT